MDKKISVIFVSKIRSGLCSAIPKCEIYAYILVSGCMYERAAGYQRKKKIRRERSETHCAQNNDSKSSTQWLLNENETMSVSRTLRDRVVRRHDQKCVYFDMKILAFEKTLVDESCQDLQDLFNFEAIVCQECICASIPIYK